MPTLADLVSSLDSIAERDPSGAGPVIYAQRPWNPECAAVVIYGEHRPEEVAGRDYAYLLEVELAKEEVIEVWSEWRDGVSPSPSEAVGAVIWYAELDAYELIDQIDKDRADLLVRLSDLIRLLEAHGEDRWARWLADRKDRIAHGDAHAARQLRDSFGGMGSLNDLLVHPANGHHVRGEDVHEVNQRLAELTTEVWVRMRALLTALDGA